MWVGPSPRSASSYRGKGGLSIVGWARRSSMVLIAAINLAAAAGAAMGSCHFRAARKDPELRDVHVE